jgi:pimeloyl-ACP methyl ester carboxylesterase
VDVGGYRLFVRCTGEGAPPVILDAGAGGSFAVWYLVEPAVARITRVCAYDLANRGIGDRGPAPNTRAQMVGDLRTLLAEVLFGGPDVLVGQSFGRMNMQLYVRAYPAEAAGLVLVDAAHEDGL